jgi:hypothetical protein
LAEKILEDIRKRAVQEATRRGVRAKPPKEALR